MVTNCIINVHIQNQTKAAEKNQKRPTSIDRNSKLKTSNIVYKIDHEKCIKTSKYMTFYFDITNINLKK